MAMSWHMMMEFTPPLVGCLVSGANHRFTALRKARECVIAISPAALAAEVVQAWIDPRRRAAKTLHHRGHGTFVVDGETLRLKSRMP